ncbi:non-ribosomal peptide synthetase [Brevibacillus dissolubilis]|uniref:non-ribosomal peptide synthetase n=1 Tax=Brevibacillus dissolubilis TaxID=1844116 RepID=UPI00111703D4|nr:non-ribosomal peptide synthetase [Brevibacillus dissolubilis]
MGNKVEIDKIYSLSPLQKGMLFHSMVEPDSVAYLEHYSIDIDGALYIEHLEKSFNMLLQRHDVFRTIFLFGDTDEPKQIVLKKRTSKIKTYDITRRPEAEKQAFLDEFEESDKRKRFNLSRDVLIRITVIQVTESHYRLSLCFHHIIMDGWSVGIIINELFQIYKRLIHNEPSLVEQPHPFAHYIKWLREQDKQEAIGYWKDYLANYEQKISVIPHLREIESNTAKIYQYEEYKFQISQTDAQALTTLAHEQGVTINTVIKAIWGILLQRYNNVEDVVFGTVISGRSADVTDINQMVGMFINSIPVRIQNSKETTLAELLKKIQEASIASEQYGYLSLAEVQANSDLNSQLVNHLMLFEYNFSADALKQDHSLGFDIHRIKDYEQTNYDFMVSVNMTEGITVTFKYNAHVYKQQDVRKIETHFHQIKKAFLVDQHMLIHQIEVVDSEEKEVLINRFNPKPTAYDHTKKIQDLFEKQVMLQPSATAVVFQGASITYAELNEKADRLARYLRSRITKPDSIVAIATQRSIEMITGILATLKAGAAFLPIDPKFPQERIQYMLQDSQTTILLTDESVGESIRFDGEVLELAAFYTNSPEETEPIMPVTNLTDLAYVIYTSGSTGNPKGVMIEHHSVINFFQAISENIDVRAGRSILGLTTISFDIFILEILLPLAVGMKIVLADEMQQNDAEAIASLLLQSGVDMIQLTPSRLQLLLGSPYAQQALKQVSKIMVGGEAFPLSMLKQLKAVTDARIYNMYGPTEVTIWAVMKELTDEESISIGRPLKNISAYVVDKYNKLLPHGAVGELCLAGAGVARGYLGKPDLTAKVFVENPYQPGTYMYKTGDLARWLPNGELEYIGRSDFQVKVRGVRIELGEIEYQLSEHPAIQEAVVVIRHDSSGNPYICGYYVSAAEVDQKDIRKTLLEKLPTYMVPSILMRLESIPLTPNGKTDRLRLPEPLSTHDTAGSLPKNEMEKKVADIWRDILGVTEIGVNQNFFDLGGHSIKAMNLISRIKREMNRDLPLSKFFEDPTVEHVSSLLLEAEKEIQYHITPAETKEYYRVSSAQKRLLVLLSQLDEASSISYNIPVVVQIHGKLDICRLEEAFHALILRHESLRTTFHWMDAEPMQKIHESPPFHLEYTEARSEEVDSIIQGWIQPFDVEQAPLLRAGVIQTALNQYVLVMDMLHVITDGTSIGTMVGELMDFYAGKTSPDLKIQYKDYSEWQHEFLQSETIQKQADYWLSVFSGNLPVLNLPTDYSRPDVQSFAGETVVMDLDKQMSDRLYAYVSESGTTLFMFFMAVYSILLSKLAVQDEVIVGVPVAGRTHVDLEQIIGVFANTIALRNFPTGNKSFADYLQEVKKHTWDALDHQDYQFDDLVRALKIERDVSRNPLFDVMLSVHNNNFPEVNVEGLRIVPEKASTHTSRFDLTLLISETNHTIGVELEYNTQLFKRETIDQYLNYLVTIMNQVTQNPQVLLQDIEIIDQETLNAIQSKFKSSEKKVSIDVTFNF